MEQSYTDMSISLFCSNNAKTIVYLAGLCPHLLSSLTYLDWSVRHETKDLERVALY